MSQPSNYRDHIVLGVGGAGASTLYWLTKLAPEKSTLGIEQFEINHKRGSSHDYSRVMRFLYHDASYIDFVEDAFACWKELEADSGQKIYHRAGGLMMSANPEEPTPAEEKLFQLYLDAVKPYPALGCKEMSKEEVKQMFPQFDFSKYKSKFLYDPASGYVQPCKAIEAALKVVRAKQANCTILENTKVTRVERTQDGLYEVHTSNTDGGGATQIFTTPKLFMTSGAWSRDLLHDLNVTLPFRVFNEQMSYYGIDPAKIENYQVGKFPVFFQVSSHCGGFIYGGPVLEIQGLKIATSLGFADEVPTGDQRSFDVNNDKARATDDFLRTYLPEINPKDNILHKRCLYTVTPDYEPVIDNLSSFGHPNIYVFAGCGSGFKFISAIGRYFAESAINNGKSTIRVPKMLKVDRPAIKDPNFKLNDVPF